MISPLLAICLFLPLRQEMNLELMIAQPPTVPVQAYRNGNFRQEVRAGERGLLVNITAHDISMTPMNDRVETSAAALERLEPTVRDLYLMLKGKSPYLQDFLRNTGLYLREAITYSEEELPQDPVSVLANRRGHCVGYANLVQALLAGAGVRSRAVRGFYLRENGRELIPVAHRWLEIQLPGRPGLFFDPQYQNFTSRYIVIPDGVAFENIEKFSARLLNQSIRVADQ